MTIHHRQVVDSMGCQTENRATHHRNLGQLIPNAQTLSPDLESLKGGENKASTPKRKITSAAEQTGSLH